LAVVPEQEILPTAADPHEPKRTGQAAGCRPDPLQDLVRPCGSVEDRRAVAEHVAELVRVGQADAQRLCATHGEPGDGAVGGTTSYPVLPLDEREHVLEQVLRKARREHPRLALQTDK